MLLRGRRRRDLPKPSLPPHDRELCAPSPRRSNSSSRSRGALRCSLAGTRARFIWLRQAQLQLLDSTDLLPLCATGLLTLEISRLAEIYGAGPTVTDEP